MEVFVKVESGGESYIHCEGMMGARTPRIPSAWRPRLPHCPYMEVVSTTPRVVPCGRPLHPPPFACHSPHSVACGTTRAWHPKGGAHRGRARGTACGVVRKHVPGVRVTPRSEREGGRHCFASASPLPRFACRPRVVCGPCACKGAGRKGDGRGAFLRGPVCVPLRTQTEGYLPRCLRAHLPSSRPDPPFHASPAHARMGALPTPHPVFVDREGRGEGGAVSQVAVHPRAPLAQKGVGGIPRSPPRSCATLACVSGMQGAKGWGGAYLCAPLSIPHLRTEAGWHEPCARKGRKQGPPPSMRTGKGAPMGCARVRVTQQEGGSIQTQFACSLPSLHPHSLAMLHAQRGRAPTGAGGRKGRGRRVLFPSFPRVSNTCLKYT